MPRRIMLGTYYVYVSLSDKTGRRYTGSSQDIEDRVTRHNAGRSKATRHGAPWQLVHFERFSSRAEAIAREKYLKTGQGRKELDELFSTRDAGPS